MCYHQLGTLSRCLPYTSEDCLKRPFAGVKFCPMIIKVMRGNATGNWNNKKKNQKHEDTT
jgi:hypothetical protein